MNMIEVQDLKKYYGDFAALGGVSFTIRSGEIIGLLGLNGAGKSTILKILASYLLPSAGLAKIAGYSVEEQPQEVRKLIGFLPDEPPLYEEMTVERYLHFVAKMKRVSSANVHSYVNEAMSRTNILGEKDTLIRELSHGYRQRVGIAAALAHKPKVLILDEPINGLDPVQIVEMRDLIRNLGGDYTVILSSHILSEITQTCDRTLIIDRGLLVAEGTQEQIQKQTDQFMQISCVTQKVSDELRALLKSHAQVKSFDAAPAATGLWDLKIQTLGDIRPELASMMVNSKSGLVEMTKEKVGLEKVFMQLVKSSGGGAQL